MQQKDLLYNCKTGDIIHRKLVHELPSTHFRICRSCRICLVCFGVDIFALGTILRAHSVFVAMWTDITTWTNAPREREKESGSRKVEKEKTAKLPGGEGLEGYSNSYLSEGSFAYSFE